MDFSHILSSSRIFKAYAESPGSGESCLQSAFKSYSPREAGISFEICLYAPFFVVEIARYTLSASDILNANIGQRFAS